MKARYIVWIILAILLFLFGPMFATGCASYRTYRAVVRDYGLPIASDSMGFGYRRDIFQDGSGKEEYWFAPDSITKWHGTVIQEVH